MAESRQPSSDTSVDRRGFFREILRRGVQRAAVTAETLAQKLNPPLPQPVTVPPPPLRFLRPPGALPEPQFAQACTRCDLCVRACPAQCIRMDPHTADGLPYILPRLSPCVVCEDLSCMKACPTGALQRLSDIRAIAMGRAVVRQDVCLRNPLGGNKDCRACLEPCPLGEEAIGLDQAGRVEVRAGCIGCGLCERACPTEPASIFIQPR